MRKRQNNLSADVILTGLSYGEHTMNPDRVVSDLEAALADCGNSFVVRCIKEKPMEKDMYLTIARYAKENGMHFSFLYAYQHAPDGRRSHLDADIIAGVKEIAGDLFLGEMFGEIGSAHAAKDMGYFDEEQMVLARRREEPMAYAETMADAGRMFTDIVREMTEYNKSMGLDESLVVEASMLQSTILHGGVTIPVLEVLPGNPERLVAATRGAAVAYGRKMWGGFIAHEWYGGMRHEDELKRKRLDLTYKYLYLSGSNIAYLESGNTEINSYGVELDYDAPLCGNYRRAMRDFHKYAKENPRLKYGPYTKVAFVFGNDDGYTEFLGGASWEQFGRENFGKSDRERSWEILSDVYRSPDWHSPFAFEDGGLDLGHSPAYGAYDIVPANTPIEVLSNYDYLIFLGHNTMNEDLYKKLTLYVKSGGTLLMSVAHLSTNSARVENTDYINEGDFTELFGCKISGYTRESHGVKFVRDSNVEKLKYPGTSNEICDPILWEGYADYAKVNVTSAEVKSALADGFFSKISDGTPVLLENKLGSGVAMLTTHRNYPGDPAVLPFYKLIVKLLLTASHQNADMKVTGSDKVRFSLFYDEAGREQLCLLNTMYNSSASVTVHYKGEENTYTLAPTELKNIFYG